MGFSPTCPGFESLQTQSFIRDLDIAEIALVRGKCNDVDQTHLVLIKKLVQQFKVSNIHQYLSIGHEPLVVPDVLVQDAAALSKSIIEALEMERRKSSHEHPTGQIPQIVKVDYFNVHLF